MPQKFTGQACTPNTHVRSINGMLLRTKYTTHTVSENSRTPVDGGGGARMYDVRVSRGRSWAYGLPN